MYVCMLQLDIADALHPLFALCAVNDVKRAYMLCKYVNIYLLCKYVHIYLYTYICIYV